MSWATAFVALDALGCTGFLYVLSDWVGSASAFTIGVLIAFVAGMTYCGALWLRTFVAVDADGITFRNVGRVQRVR